MGEIAGHLETACRDLDLDLLGSLLDPEVRWTGLCSDRAQVLDWYRDLLAEGTVATVRSVEVDRDAVVIGMAVSRRAEGARPAPPQQLYQVFTVDGAASSTSAVTAIAMARWPAAVRAGPLNPKGINHEKPGDRRRPAVPAPLRGTGGRGG